MANVCHLGGKQTAGRNACAIVRNRRDRLTVYRHSAVIATDCHFCHAIEPPAGMFRKSLQADFRTIEFIVCYEPVLNEERSAWNKRCGRSRQDR